ncbi:hypothetical protein COEREDRAFT_48604, partial [Coemansia reversa NRRL 1564]
QVDVCTIMAIGFYFFWHFHMTSEGFPNLADADNWLKIKLFKGKKKIDKPELSYT